MQVYISFKLSGLRFLMFVLTSSFDLKMVKERKYKNGFSRARTLWMAFWTSELLFSTVSYTQPSRPSHNIIHKATIYFLFVFDHSAILIFCRGGGVGGLRFLYKPIHFKFTDMGRKANSNIDVIVYQEWEIYALSVPLRLFVLHEANLIGDETSHGPRARWINQQKK